MSLFLHLNRFGEILHFITCSPEDPPVMGAIRMRVQTTDKTLKKIHTTDFIFFGLQLKYKSSIYNITFSSETSPHLNQDIEHHLQAKTVLIYVDFEDN